MNRLLALLIGTGIGLAIVLGVLLRSVERVSESCLITPIAPEVPLDLPPNTAAEVQPDDLGLELSENEWGWDAELTNLGDQTLLLVAPGDGSEVGWRTPILTWVLQDLEERPLQEQPWGRCGNMNPLTAEELLIVEPGESFAFSVSAPQAVDADRFHATLEYRNDPDHAWKGGELGPHDAGALAAVARSTRCSITSNRVLIDRR